MSRGKGMNLSPEFGFFIGSWQPYFAWTQTRLYDGSRVWLRTVYRRRVQRHNYLAGGPDAWWLYARKSDMGLFVK